jgi:hypothetical protein
MGKGQSAWGLARGKGDLSPDYLSSDICSLSSGIWLRGSSCEVRGQGMVGMGSAHGAWRAEKAHGTRNRMEGERKGDIGIGEAVVGNNKIKSIKFIRSIFDTCLPGRLAFFLPTSAFRIPNSEFYSLSSDICSLTSDFGIPTPSL